MKNNPTSVIVLIMMLSSNLLAQSKVETRPNPANRFNANADELMRKGNIQEAISLYEKAAEAGMASARGRADLAKAKLKYAGPSEKDKEEIRNVIAATCDALVKGDLDGVMKNYSDQAIEIPPNQVPNVGVGNIRSRLNDNLAYGSYTKFERQVELIEGMGSIALASVNTESTFKASDGNSYDQRRDDIFLLRKQQDGQWRILAHHLYIGNDDRTGKPSEDKADIRKVIDQWSFFIKPGEVLGQQHVENLAAIHSSQCVDIRPNQRSFIGMPNLRALWAGFKGIKWAQFTDYSFDVNYFSAIGPEGYAQKAIAWGIGDHSNYANGSEELSQYLFPWAMILTKEVDGRWRILVYHFYLG